MKAGMAKGSNMRFRSEYAGFSSSNFILLFVNNGSFIAERIWCFAMERKFGLLNFSFSFSRPLSQYANTIVLDQSISVQS